VVSVPLCRHAQDLAAFAIAHAQVDFVSSAAMHESPPRKERVQ
jgi:hypothetical protein